MVINKCVKHFGLWKNKIGNAMTISKKGQTATLALLTYEVVGTVEPNRMIIIELKVEGEHHAEKKKRASAAERC